MKVRFNVSNLPLQILKKGKHSRAPVNFQRVIHFMLISIGSVSKLEYLLIIYKFVCAK